MSDIGDRDIRGGVVEVVTSRESITFQSRAGEFHGRAIWRRPVEITQDDLDAIAAGQRVQEYIRGGR